MDFKTIIPKTRDGAVPTITSRYATISLCDLYSVNHYPKGGVPYL